MDPTADDQPFFRLTDNKETRMLWDRVMSMLRHGHSCYQNGNLMGALEQYDNCIRLSEGRGGIRVVHAARGETYERMGRLDDALADMRKCVELSPLRHEGYFKAAKILEKQDRLPTALEMCDQALRLVPAVEQAERGEICEVRERISAELRRREPRLPSACHVQKLPVELLSMIFIEWLRLDPVGPLLASHVSRHWRDAACGTSELWTKLILGGRSPGLKASTWMERTRGRRFSLRVRADFPLSGLIDQPLPYAIERHLGSLDELALMRLPHAAADRMLQFYGERLAEHLEGLRISTADSFTSYDLTPFVALKTLDLHNFSIEMKPFTCLNLKTLRLRNASQSRDHPLELLFMLSSLSALEDLGLSSDRSFCVQNFPVSSTKHVFPKLHSLEVEGKADWVVFVDRVSLPALENLKVGYCTSINADAFLGHLDPPNPPIVHLHVHRTAFVPRNLIARLREMPMLANLEITSCISLTDFVIESMLATSSTWIHLEHLDFSHSTISGEPLLALVFYRTLRGTKFGANSAGIESTDEGSELPVIKAITSLRIDSCYRVDCSIIARLRDLVPHVTCHPANW